MSGNTELSVAEMFDRIAFRYDFLNSLLSMRQDKRWRKELVKSLPKVQNGHLLDVACGTGDVIQSAYTFRKDYTFFTGIDISKEMLKIAEKKLKPEVCLKEMSAELLNFKDSTFDAITISFGLRNVQNKEKALKEFLRVLKPGSSLLILEFFNAPSGFMSYLFRFYFHVILPIIAALFSDKKAYSYLPHSVETFYKLEELKKILSDLGFEFKRQKTFLWGACTLIELSKIS